MSIKIETSLEELMPIMKECLSSGKSFRFSPRGISMLPLLREGKDSVLLSPLPEKLKKYDVPLYQRDDGKYVLHRITAVGETITCIGDNQFVYESGLRHDQMIAVMTGFYRGERFVSVDSLFYKIYCRFWHYSRPLRYFMKRAIGFLRRHLK
ncbi:MAG: S24/S26 family peptidase [Oscillospiraceae bacterium]|nr:S24/S26 family peptidase [Oscillospiraceae bacterium]